MTNPPDHRKKNALYRWITEPVDKGNVLLLFVWYTLLMVLAIPFGWLRSRRYPDRPSRGWNEVFHRVNRLFLTLCSVRYKVVGSLRPDGRTALYASNHGSWIDGCFFQALMERDGFAVTAPINFFPWPFSFWLTKVGVIAVARSAEEERLFPHAFRRDQAVEEIARRLKAGESGLIFPEGHLELSPKLAPFKTGAVRAALLAGVPLVPVSVRGDFHMITIKGLFMHTHPVTITFHDVAHEIPTDRPDLAKNDELAELWTTQLMHRIGHGLERKFEQELPACDCRDIFRPAPTRARKK